MRTPNEVGKFIRETLVLNGGLTNRVIADLVVAKFPEQKFDVVKLCQRIANTRFTLKREATTGTEGTPTGEATETTT